MDLLSEQTERANIFSFTDYRLFLKARLGELKAENPKFSYRYLAKKVKVSDSYFKHILELRRNLNINHVSAVAEVFHLTPDETYHLTLMVLKKNVTDPSMDKSIGELLLSSRVKMISRERLSLSDFFRSVMTEFSKMDSFRPEAEWMKAHLKDQDLIPPDELVGLLKAPAKSNAKPSLQHDLRSFLYTAVSLSEVEDLGNSCAASGVYAFNRQQMKMLQKVSEEFHDKIAAIAQEAENPDIVLSVGHSFLELSKGKEPK